MTPAEPVPADLDVLPAWCEHGHACTEVARLRAEAAALRTALGDPTRARRPTRGGAVTRDEALETMRQRRDYLTKRAAAKAELGWENL